jgi:hypothetical protein
MLKILKILAYAVIIGIIMFFFLIIIETILAPISSSLFDYELTNYQHQIDFLFENEPLKSLEVKEFFKSGERGSFYLIKIDSLSQVAVIETRNFSINSMKEVEVKPVKEIKLSQGKTYLKVLKDSFPIVQLVLNPRKSSNLKILFEDPFYPVLMDQNNNSYLIKGTFQVVSFGNTQNCSIVSYPKGINNELLIIKAKGRIYFITNTSAKSIEKIINKSLLQ